MLLSILIAVAVFWVSISIGIYFGRRHVLNNPPPANPPTTSPNSPPSSTNPSADQLQPGDRIELRLTDKAGVASAQPLVVDADGMVTIPVSGRLKAQYLTPAQLEQAIAKTYKDRNLIPDGQMHIVRVPTTAPVR